MQLMRQKHASQLRTICAIPNGGINTWFFKVYQISTADELPKKSGDDPFRLINFPDFCCTPFLVSGWCPFSLWSSWGRRHFRLGLLGSVVWYIGRWAAAWDPSLMGPIFPDFCWLPAFLKGKNGKVSMDKCTSHSSTSDESLLRSPCPTFRIVARDRPLV